jgi:hypothetical protein
MPSDRCPARAVKSRLYTVRVNPRLEDNLSNQDATGGQPPIQKGTFTGYGTLRQASYPFHRTVRNFVRLRYSRCACRVLPRAVFVGCRVREVWLTVSKCSLSMPHVSVAHWLSIRWCCPLEVCKLLLCSGTCNYALTAVQRASSALRYYWLSSRCAVLAVKPCIDIVSSKRRPNNRFACSKLQVYRMQCSFYC